MTIPLKDNNKLYIFNTTNIKVIYYCRGNMASQSEAALENNLIETLIGGGYEFVSIKDEKELEVNFKIQLGKFNKTTFNNDEFRKILIHLEGGSIFEKAKKLRDQHELSREDETFYVKFLNKKEWCKNIFQVSNQIIIKGKYEKSL